MPDDTPGSDGEVMDINDLARYLKISVRTAEDWDRAGVGPPRAHMPGRLRRWRKQRVDEWLDSNRTATGATAG